MLDKIAQVVRVNQLRVNQWIKTRFDDEDWMVGRGDQLIIAKKLESTNDWIIHSYAQFL